MSSVEKMTNCLIVLPSNAKIVLRKEDAFWRIEVFICKNFLNETSLFFNVEAVSAAAMLVFSMARNETAEPKGLFRQPKKDDFFTAVVPEDIATYFLPTVYFSC